MNFSCNLYSRTFFLLFEIMKVPTLHQRSTEKDLGTRMLSLVFPFQRIFTVIKIGKVGSVHIRSKCTRIYHKFISVK